MAFASVLYPGRCLASQPIHLGSEVGEGQRCKRGGLRPPPQASPGGERQVDGQHHRLCPMALTALCHSAAAVSSICSFDSSSSFPSPRGIPGHSARPRRSRPDPSLPPHRHYLRRCHYQSPLHHHSAAAVSSISSSSLPSPRYCHLVPSGQGGLCASSALGLSQAPSAAIPIHLFRSLLVAQSCRPGGR